MLGLINRRNMIIWMLVLAIVPWGLVCEGKKDKEMSEVNQGRKKAIADAIGLRDEQKPGTNEESEARSTVTLTGKEYLNFLNRMSKMESYNQWREGFGACEKIFEPAMEHFEEKEKEAQNLNHRLVGIINVLCVFVVYLTFGFMFVDICIES